MTSVGLGEIDLHSDFSDVPQVGIFWHVNGRLVIVGKPVESAELWNQRYRNDPRSHQAQWREFAKAGAVPGRADWAEYPRGRVIYDMVSGSFHVYADRCVLSNPELVAQIKAVLNLPTETPADGDDHYRCAACRQRMEGLPQDERR